MAKINEQKALEMFLAGATNQQIADEFGVTRQGADFKRQKLIRLGVLTKAPKVGALVPRQVEVKGDGHRAPSLEEIDVWVTARVKDANEVARLRNIVAAQENQITLLKAELEEKTVFYNKRLQQKREYEQAVRQGELPAVGPDSGDAEVS